MRLTYGYDLKENDDMLTPPKRIAEIMKQFFFPGAALVNHLPFRAVLHPLLSFECLMVIFSPTPPFVGSLVQV